MAHMPGPWAITGRIAGIKETTAFIDGNPHGKYPTIFVSSHTGKRKEAKQFEDSIALIAAAPELLEACKRTVKFCADNYVDVPFLDEVLTDIYAAIAKAEGKSL